MRDELLSTKCPFRESLLSGMSCDMFSSLETQDLVSVLAGRTLFAQSLASRILSTVLIHRKANLCPLRRLCLCLTELGLQLFPIAQTLVWFRASLIKQFRPASVLRM